MAPKADKGKGVKSAEAQRLAAGTAAAQQPTPELSARPDFTEASEYSARPDYDTQPDGSANS